MARTALPGESNHSVARYVLYFLLLLFALVYLTPLWVMVVNSLKPLSEIQGGNLLGLPLEPTLDAWSKAMFSACVGIECPGVLPYFTNSLLMAFPAVVIGIMIGSITGYALTKWRFKGSDIIFALILFGCFIPFQAVLVPMAKVLGWLGLFGSIPGLVMVHVVYGICFTTLFFRNYYAAFPDELVKAATIDGAGFFQIFWRIMLPNSIPIIVVTFIWQFTNIWNDFLFGVSYTSGGSQPITVALNNIVNTSTGVKEYNVDFATAIIAAFPTLVVYIVAGRYFVRGLMAGAVKG